MLTHGDMVKRLRDAIEACASLREFARRHRISPAYVSKAARGEMTFGPKLAKALGVKAVTGWEER